jgi:Zn-dependent M16 (insulinase) family peptidase
MEGILWRRIRGSGLAYEATMVAEAGQVRFEVRHSPNAYAAWKKAKNIIEEISSGQVRCPHSQLTCGL